MRAPRARASRRDSTTQTTPPSPKTKPSRAASKGREAATGSSLRRESACMLASPAMPSSEMLDSVPPTKARSASPYSMICLASMKA